MRKLVIPGVVLCALLLAAPVAAHNVTHATTSTAEADYDDANQAYDFFGTISSPKAKCIPIRKVLVYRINQNNDSVHNVATTFTNQDGDWRMEDTVDTGGAPYKYYVKVSRKVIASGGGHLHECARYKPASDFHTDT